VNRNRDIAGKAIYKWCGPGHLGAPGKKALKQADSALLDALHTGIFGFLQTFPRESGLKRQKRRLEASNLGGRPARMGSNFRGENHHDVEV
jgi:hypothetical protein